MRDDPLNHLLQWAQNGVVSRRQLIELEATDSDIQRLVRRRALIRVHRGVYINHTGQLTWEQRAWAAVLALEPAALSHGSAMPGGPRTGPIHVAIEEDRVAPIRVGVVTHRMTDLATRVNWNAGPPSVWPAHATLDVASAADGEAAVFAVLASALHTRQVWPESLESALADRKRVPQRALLKALIHDLATGQHSVLERGFARLLDTHQLPQPSRQVRSAMSAGIAYRDAVFSAYNLVVELDGRAFHDTATARDRDATRDLEAATANLQTIRLTYGQVFRDGCATAGRLSSVLNRRGWSGAYSRCPTCG